MAESEEDLNSLLVKVKEGSEKVGLKLNIHKTKIIASGPIQVQVQVKITQFCLTPCKLMDCGPPVSSVHGILQARILEWVAIPFLVNLPTPGIEPRSPTLQADSLPDEPQGIPQEYWNG